MFSDRKMTQAEVVVQVPESKVASVAENGTMSGPPVRPDRSFRWKHEAFEVVLRVLCLATCLTALSFMVTAEQASTVSIYGFHLPVFSKWSYSESFQYVVGVCAAVAAHSLLQLLISVSRLLRKSPVITSRNHAWLVFAGDQVFAYALLSAGSAASGVTNLNRTGVRHTALPNFCKPLHFFCERVVVSIAFTFISWFLVAICAVKNAVWLSKH